MYIYIQDSICKTIYIYIQAIEACNRILAYILFLNPKLSEALHTTSPL